MRALADVLRDHTPRLLRIPGVAGTGDGEVDGRPGILVLVARVTSALVAEVPREIEGYPVEIRETGEVRTLE